MINLVVYTGIYYLCTIKRTSRKAQQIKIMPNLETNLRSAAAENFSLYPQCYPTVNGQPTEETLTNLNELADKYGEYDGFWDAGMSVEECREIVKKEFDSFLTEQ